MIDKVVAKQASLIFTNVGLFIFFDPININGHWILNYPSFLCPLNLLSSSIVSA